jgi:Domain of Unknown Function (DUF1521)
MQASRIGGMPAALDGSERKRKDGPMSSVTGTTTLNLALSVPRDQASELMSIFAQMGLVQTSDDETTDEDAGYSSDFFDGGSLTPTLTQSTDSSGNVEVDDGTYLIEEGTDDDGSVKVIDKKTGKVITKIWGDPHINNGSGQNVANVQDHAVNVTLANGTNIHIDPTALTNGVSHVGAVTVTNGNNQVQINSKAGSGQGFENGVTTTGVKFVPGASTYAQYDNDSAVNLFATSDGNLFVSNNDTGGLTSLAATNGAPMELDTAQQATGIHSSSGVQASLQQIGQFFSMLIAYEQQQQQQQFQQLQYLLGSLGSSGFGSSGFGLGGFGSSGFGLGGFGSSFNFSNLFEMPQQIIPV